LSGQGQRLTHVLSRLKSPELVQKYLDKLRYSTDTFYRSARRIVRHRKANCFDGALLAAAAFQAHRRSPLILDLRAVNDYDHVVALYRSRGCWGAVAVSNTVGLRFREPIYRTLRELALSYFEFFYNAEAQKTLREYSVALNLRLFDFDWAVCDDRLEEIAVKLDQVRHYDLLKRGLSATLCPVDPRSFRAGLLGANRAGLFKDTT